jgi:hypothetical protein
MRAALAEIDALAVVRQPSRLIRIAGDEPGAGPQRAAGAAGAAGA